MTRPAQLSPARAAAAFTLIEMIGVLAIMAILASVIVPNVVRTMNRAAIDAEAKTLEALGEQVKLYVTERGTLPDPTPPVTGIPATAQDIANLETWNSWCRDLGQFADLSIFDLAVTRRATRRVYLPDPAAPPDRAPRVIILSSMVADAGFQLPRRADVSTAALFQALWDTPTDAIPTVNWADRPRWAAMFEGGRHFLIERVDLRPILGKHIEVRLWNQGATTTTYWADSFGAAAARPIAKDEVRSVPLTRGGQLRLYDSTGGQNRSFVVPVNTSFTTVPYFVFDGTNWTPQ